MGEVYKARDTRLRSHSCGQSSAGASAEKSDALERFDREARAISSLSHPNICSLSTSARKTD